MQLIQQIRSKVFLSVLVFVPIIPIGTFANSSNAKTKASVSPERVEPSTALELLKKGNERFIAGNLRTDGESKHDVERLSDSQSPHSIVLSCSDSRVPPELVFDQKLGEIFTVRSAGETLSPTAIGTIEYAVEKLGSRLIVVLGHTECGAVNAAIKTLDGSSAGSANLDKLVADIHPRIRPIVNGKSPSKHLHAESSANANGVAKDLGARSKIIAEAIKSGKVKVVVGMYDLSDGKVAFK